MYGVENSVITVPKKKMIKNIVRLIPNPLNFHHKHNEISIETEVYIHNTFFPRIYVPKYY